MIDLSHRYERYRHAIRKLFEERMPEIAAKAKTGKLWLYEGDKTGTWTVGVDDRTVIARFAVSFMPNCGAVAVLADSEVMEEYRHRGIGGMLFRLRIAAAEASGVKVLLCTVRRRNEAQRHLCKKHGWREVTGFVNPETGNEVGLWMLEVEN